MSDALHLAEQLREHSLGFDVQSITARTLDDAATELERLHTLINTPHTTEFLEAVKLEAMHQRERWAAEHDAGKADADWFWLIGYLAGKGLGAATMVESTEAFKPDGGVAWTSFIAHNRDKALHHIITTAAACLNWHAARTGADTRMRPGIAPPSSESDSRG